MKIAVIYHSVGGNTKHLAEAVTFGIESVVSIEVKSMDLDHLDEEFISDAGALVVGTPTYCGSYTWQLKRWFDTTSLDLSGKLGSVFATEDYLGGGADVAEMGIAGMMLVRGMLVYSAGFTRGQPFTHYGAVSIKAGNDEQYTRARILGERVADKAWELFS